MGHTDSIRVNSEIKESTPFAAEEFDKISPIIHKASAREVTNYSREHLDLRRIDGMASDLDRQIPNSSWGKMQDLEKMTYILERIARSERRGGMSDPPVITETSRQNTTTENEQSLDSPFVDCDENTDPNTYVMFADATPFLEALVVC